MSDNKNDTRNQVSSNESKGQKSEGFNKNQPDTIDPSKKERVPNEKVPNIGDPKKKTIDEDFSNKKTTSIITTERKTPITGATSATEHQEQSKHDAVTKAQLKTNNQHESDQTFNKDRY